MAVPVIPILKKIAVAVVSDKKGRKVVVGVILGVLFMVMMPIVAVLGIFSGGIDLGLDNINSLIQEQQAVGETTLTKIEETMVELGYSELKVEEAQTIFIFALFDNTEEENVAERLVGCFEFKQTDEELVNNVNDEFGTAINHTEFTEILKEIREKYSNQEENTTQ